MGSPRINKRRISSSATVGPRAKPDSIRPKPAAVCNRQTPIASGTTTTARCRRACKAAAIKSIESVATLRQFALSNQFVNNHLGERSPTRLAAPHRLLETVDANAWLDGTEDIVMQGVGGFCDGRRH